MATRISTGAAKAACDALTARLNGGYIEIRSGAQPASVADVATGTLLGTLPLDATAFGPATDASPAVATANPITSDTAADASGTAGWFRAYATGGTAEVDGSITTTADGSGDLDLDDTNIIEGGTITVTAWTISHPTA